MEPDDGISQKFPVEMRIDLSGKDGFMSQHFLHCAKVSAPVNQLCGKRMAECVRTDILLYASG